MSYDVRELQPLVKYPTTSILQAYFIPVAALEAFLARFWEVIDTHQVNLLNVSLRYVPQQKGVLLNYAPKDSIAIVVYINIGNYKKAYQRAQKWTVSLIDHALALGGTYYLPYLPFATVAQFVQAYPHTQEYLIIKAK